MKNSGATLPFGIGTVNEDMRLSNQLLGIEPDGQYPTGFLAESISQTCPHICHPEDLGHHLIIQLTEGVECVIAAPKRDGGFNRLLMMVTRQTLEQIMSITEMSEDQLLNPPTCASQAVA